MSAVPVPQLHYRPMRATDLQEVARLEKTLYEFPWSLGNFRDSLNAGYDCWVACEGETVIGYAVLMIALDEAHLLNIAIASASQRRGTGRAFLKKILGVAKAAGCLIVYLEVRPSNVAARHLYRTSGFQQIAIRPNYYPSVAGREDALFLGLTLR
ncbi:ribosomal protein S18-alanine N-acetyltransferase [Usitatibacter palustris]|uniref:[Ribosomal protein bS18]-alanine N-acetyltransferase n=1 Tax=Usitatibacter palustris TaxID=2732487 RepID=A0A6M4H6L8_9PROT|nr:ribosomal protein S18-alanine N-acetyltransferase [Usitatibacter palustris]QJR15002.1 [Ribosomal protein S18]-alanine N-acetyltransferase [Usitatibacter palustris]